MTQLDDTQLDNDQMTQSMDSSKHSKTHEPEVNTDPDLLYVHDWIRGRYKLNMQNAQYIGAKYKRLA